MAIPILKSSDIDRTLAFFTGKLGANLVWRERPANPSYAVVNWEEHEIHLSSHAGDGAFGTAVYFRVEDVGAVFSMLLSRGWTPIHDRGPVFEAPTDQTWGLRELYVADPDGNCLRFGSPLAN